jgi:predicted nucleic acid-binding protein
MTGSSRNPFQFVFWDSCVFLAWLNEEADKPLHDIEEFISDVESGKRTMQLSAISYTEIINLIDSRKPLAATAGTRFRQWVKRPGVDIYDVDPRVADKAAELKEASIALRATVPKAVLKIPDALIAATAIVYKADVLHTFDPDLLNIAPHGIFGALVVSRPVHPTRTMPLFENRK